METQPGQYAYVPVVHNSHKNTFANCIFFDKSVFELLSTRNCLFKAEHQDADSPQMPRKIQFVTLKHRQSGITIEIGNLQMPMAKEHKWLGLEELRRALESSAAERILMLGDWQFYYEENEEGPEMASFTADLFDSCLTAVLSWSKNLTVKRYQASENWLMRRKGS